MGNLTKHQQTALLPRLGEDGRIIEGVVTTVDEFGSARISPMGPIVGEQFDRLILRPYRTSTTYDNLRRSGCGVFHVVDDVLLVTTSAIGQPDPQPSMHTAPGASAPILDDACRWYAFQVVDMDESEERTTVVANVVCSGEQRAFFGFNRAKHAVLEAAILATRVDLLEYEVLDDAFHRLSSPIRKTGGAQELRAFSVLMGFLKRKLGEEFGNAWFAEADVS